MPVVRREANATIRELMSQPGIKKIRVFKSGDSYHQGVQIVVNDNKVQDLDILLTAITARIDLPFGAKKLYTTNGTQVKNLKTVKDGTDYVASSGAFVPMAYGQPPGHRSRAKSVEPSKKTKKKKKRTASVVPPSETNHEDNGHTEQKKIKKKTKKIKKKTVSDEVVIPLNSEIERKEEHHSGHHDVSRHEDQIRSVSRYAERPPSTRPQSRMSSKSAHLHAKGEEHHLVHSSDDEQEHEKREEQGSEIHIPHNNKNHSDGEDHDGKEESKRKEDPKEVLGEEAHKKRKSVYQWGDLSSFTKNIESLLRRKE